MYPTLTWFLILAGLMLLSAFCSASEAALFSLTTDERRAMRDGTRSERVAIQLLKNSERLLSVLLFCNLIANMMYFGIISIYTLKIQKTDPTLAWTWSLGALLLIIVFCELIPKAVAVLIPRTVSRLSGFPLTGLCWICTPILPILTVTTKLSRRLFLPAFHSEALLELRDLERAVEMANGKMSSARREKELLQTLLSLSETTAEEIMRPRTLLPIFPSPVRLEDLKNIDRSFAWVFLREEADSDEITHVFPLEKLVRISQKDFQQLEKFAEPVVYIPWCRTAAGALDDLNEKGQKIGVVIDEYGATPGVILLSDILETIFSRNSERVFQLTNHRPIHPMGKNRWEISGLITVRAFCRHFGLKFPEDLDTATLGGQMMDELQKIPVPGDECSWMGFHFRILSISETSEMFLEVWPDK